MKILISSVSGIPIYEQIEAQIREQIMAGKLAAGEMLPSIRMLAKELGVAIITAKRAYDDLCAEGFTYAVAGKGVFVSPIDGERVRRVNWQELSARMRELCAFARANGFTEQELRELLQKTFREGEQ